MDYQTISSILSNNVKTSKKFRGIFMIDQLRECSREGIYIVNNDTSKGHGFHWMVFFIPSEKKEIPEFFDSFGREPTRIEILNFFSKYGEIKYSKKQIQSAFNDSCGKFSAVFAVWKACNLSMEEFLKMFTDNFIQNEEIIKKIFNSFFS
jgi:hypothetical protein